MGGLFSRLKVWSGLETVVPAALNAEFDNIISNLIPAKIDDYSVNVAQMQETKDPGGVGTENQAASMAEELKELRFMVQSITAGAQWYSAPVATLSSLNTLLNSLSNYPTNRISSGRKDANNQPMFLVPSGSLATVTLKAGGSNPNFVAYIGGTLRTFSADVPLAGLTFAPSSQNTCVVNDATMTGGNSTKIQGEYGTTITIGTIGTNITALNGKYAAFKTGAEYFLAEVDTTNNQLKNCFRGFFFDSSDATAPRVVLNNSDTITLMKLSWIFATYNSSTAGLDVCYTVPVVSKDTPSSPASGDFWYDIANATWKKYSGSAYVATSALLIGVCAQDTTKTVVARSFDFFQVFSDLNTASLERSAANTVRAANINTRVSVYGTEFKFEATNLTWDMSIDLDSGETDAASKTYYFYATDGGDKVISSVAPHDRRSDLRGFYHPSKPWRSLGECDNDGSANFMNMVRRPGAPTIIASATSSALDCGTSTTLADVTGMSIKVPCTGNKYVRIRLVPDGNTSNGSMLTSSGASSAVAFQIALLRNGTVIACFDFESNSNTLAAPANGGATAVGGVDYEDPDPPAGYNTYKLQYKTMGAGHVYVYYSKLIGYEMT